MCALKTVARNHSINFSRLFEDLKLQFEVEKGQLLDERHNLTVQLSQHKERLNVLENKILELNGLLEKQKLNNE